jgi:alkanesulfonate monooxygenase SsuD/methylene tetrahydromethanopterin reductase-like flavin-dependent oxidoreductase (luciferase family)
MAPLRCGIIRIEGGRFFKESLEEVVRAEELGFDSAWLEEHHA